VTTGIPTINYPSTPDLEFTIHSSWEDPITYADDAHRVYINVTFGPQTRMATGQGFSNLGATSGAIWDKNSGHNDPNSWDFAIRVYDDSNPTAFNDSFEEFGIEETVSILVAGNPSGNAPPGSGITALANPSQITYSANTDYWVNVSIPHLFENGVDAAPNRVDCDDVYVQNMCVNVTGANSDLDLQVPMPIVPKTDVYVWGQNAVPIAVPSNGTTAAGPDITNYNAPIWGLDDFTQLNWAVDVQAGTAEGIYWGTITITIDS